jgi:hypothetical protein
VIQWFLSFDMCKFLEISYVFNILVLYTFWWYFMVWSGLCCFHLPPSFPFILQVFDMALQQLGVANFKEMGPWCVWVQKYFHIVQICFSMLFLWYLMVERGFVATIWFLFNLFFI